MSGLVTADDAMRIEVSGTSSVPRVEVSDSRQAMVGQTIVRRALPRRGRRTVGAWCFADHLGPADVDERSSAGGIGRHPHIGLQTVTWLLDGQALHRDSLGSEQVIKPGQLNLMRAGHGVSHAEESVGHYRGIVEGIQLWIAQPAASRDGAPAFEHHAELPRVDLDRAVATVLIGDLAGATSPAQQETPLVGVDLALVGGSTTIPLHPTWEYAVIVLRGAAGLDGQLIEPGKLAYLGTGRDELVLDAAEPSRLMLLGGEPMAEDIVMWWNFVARTRDELDAAYESWRSQDDRFGRVRSSLPLIPAPPPPWRPADRPA